MDWDIEKIGEYTIKLMKENGETDTSNLDDYMREIFWSVQSRDTKRAGLVVELVKIEVEERWEEMEEEEEKKEEHHE
ncbi:MAG TPA: hypothetical protein DET40_18465 [Lentisphaeria bacterium]|nr:MAG: hypothetical protein A2X45_14605 [Lentisphaerae bacterium GWF2_50_93]HCE45528.1 hypothetical protein [Lentisphaeria bacterium]